MRKKLVYNHCEITELVLSIILWHCRVTSQVLYLETLNLK